MDPDLRAMFKQVTKGSLSGTAGGQVTEDFKINGQYVDTPDQGVVGIPYFDGYVERAALEFLEEAAQSDTPFRSEEHTSELQSLMRISYAVFCLKTKKQKTN